MTEPLSAHLRDGPEKASEILAKTTYDRCTVLFEQIRTGTRPIILRQVSQTPETYHLYQLNEHGAHCDDRDLDRGAAQSIVHLTTASDGFVGYRRDAAENVWPGEPHDKHPSWSGGDQ